MKILLLGYGKEGKAVENYFKSKDKNITFDILENFSAEELQQRDYSSYDIIFRSPSVPPMHLDNEFSATRYFFDHCPCPIIGVTGTKGKGTTCSFIKAILDALGEDAHLVGNIGFPAIDALDSLKPTSVVVFEMSSFQLWDLEKSPHISVVLRIEADHLNVHHGYDDYVNAKGHIAEYQTKEDSVIYFKDNEDSIKIADKSVGKHFSYPIEQKSEKLKELLDSLKVPGEHNKEDAEAALIAVSAYYNIPLDEFIDQNFDKLKAGLQSFRGLPHHIEFVKTVNNVDYYDDSFSASYPSLEVAIKAFPEKRVFLIAGGKDRGLDLTPIKNAIFNAPNLEKAILIGETSYKLAENEDSEKYILANTLNEAVETAKNLAEKASNAVVLLSPGAASFDMFKDFYDRGDQFQEIIKGF
ncbi:UDP-N-acetylmuramoyl-L-alanine--D-glutamate ligase [Candidatus Saccharibacteria bacterium]|nr:UDP-N-acetylmuramoyl-L-alanine--D-glutamate ligase [Candidatus Saccharibacteria bacterium]